MPHEKVLPFPTSSTAAQLELNMSSTTSSDSEFGFKTDAGDTLTDLPPAGGVKIFKRESEISRFDVDGDGKFTASELRSIDQALQQSKETISLLKCVPLPADWPRLPHPLRPWLPLPGCGG